MSIARLALIAPMLLLPAQAYAQDALGDGHALDGNLSTRGTRNTMTTRSVRDEGRFALGRSPMAGRGYQNAIGYRSNEDFRKADGQMTMYADSLYNNPWYWENIGSLPTELATSGGSGGLGREAANFNGGGYYNPWFFNSNTSNASRVDLGRRIGDFGYQDSYEHNQNISSVGYDDLKANGVDEEDEHRPLVYSIGKPNQFLRDERRSSVLRSSYEVRDLNTDPDYVGVGMAPGDIPLRYAASPLQGVFPTNHSMSAHDIGLTQYDTARIAEDERLGRGAPQVGQMWRPDFTSLTAIDNRIDADADNRLVVNRSDTTMNDLLSEIADRYEQEQGTASAADLAQLQRDYRNVLHEVVSGYGMQEANMGLDPSSIAGIPNTDSTFTEEDPELTTNPPTFTEPGTAPEQGVDTPPASPLMPLEEFGLILRHGQKVDALADDDKSRLSELIYAGQDKLASGEYYWAERRFNRALRFIPGHPLATAGLAHAQLGEGLYLSSSMTLQSLLGFQPEMIDVIYDDALLPVPQDLVRSISDLNLRLGQDADRARYAFLLAYIGHQMDNTEMVQKGLREMRAEDGDTAFIRLLDSIWLGEELPEGTDAKKESPELIPLKPVESDPAAPVEMVPDDPVNNVAPVEDPAAPPVDLDDVE
ncbi:MAG: hypothetical protein P8L37_08535 [Phycisphaerales bacterium]|nr:hypothetical protein [Phycisphaerales bacterium]